MTRETCSTTSKPAGASEPRGETIAVSCLTERTNIGGGVALIEAVVGIERWWREVGGARGLMLGGMMLKVRLLRMRKRARKYLRTKSANGWRHF